MSRRARAFPSVKRPTTSKLQRRSLEHQTGLLRREYSNRSDRVQVSICGGADMIGEGPSPSERWRWTEGSKSTHTRHHRGLYAALPGYDCNWRPRPCKHQSWPTFGEGGTPAKAGSGGRMQTLRTGP